jgi:hypothetical protein
MRLPAVPAPARHATPRVLAALVAAVVLLVLLVLATVGLEEWYALLVLACGVCLLPLVPCLLHRRDP